MDGIIQKYHPEMAAVPLSSVETPPGGQDQQMGEKNTPKNRKPLTKERKSGGAGLQTTALKNRRNSPPAVHHKSEVQSNGQA